jgi:hypothetical protein
VGQLVEVLRVEVEEFGSDGPLRGAYVDSPGEGRRMAAAALEIAGWALGPDGPPDEVEVASGAAVLSRAPLRHRRDDIAAAFPEVAAAVDSGFEVDVDVGHTPAESELALGVRLGDSVIPIGRLRLRRCWRGDLRAEPPLVSVAVVDEHGVEEALASTLSSIEVQRHPATEVLILHRPSAVPDALSDGERNGIRGIASDGGNPAALRNEGIRRSNGQLILFVEAGSALAPDALGLGVEMLARKGEACAVLDRDARGVGAALYRRSVFEELEGFDEGTRGSCDIELAERAERYDALLVPGALVGGGRWAWR